MFKTQIFVWFVLSKITQLNVSKVEVFPDPIFSAVSSKTVRPNTDHKIHVLVHPSEITGLNFTFHLTSYERIDFREIVSDDGLNKTFVKNIPRVFASTTVSIRSGQSATVTLPIPRDLAHPFYNITLRAIDPYGRIYEDFNIVYKEIETKKQSILIQSDKVIYKPGETLKFRILLLDRLLRPLNNQTLNLRISDPQQNVIKMWRGIQTQRGIFSDQLKLSSEPIQGEWNLEAEVNSDRVKHTFTVQEYILPKFDVKILAPVYLTLDNLRFALEVNAVYTFGKKIIGKCEVEISEKESRYYGAETRSVIKKAQLDGSARFEFDILFEIENGIKPDWEKEYVIRATVIEDLTGRKANASAVTIKAYQYNHKIEAINTAGKFKPGFPFTFSFRITTQDGQPVPDSYPSPVKFRHGFSCFKENGFQFKAFPPNGIVQFTVSEMPTNELLTFAPMEVTYKGQVQKFSPPQRHFSSSETYLELLVGSSEIRANSRVALEVKMNKNFSTLTVVTFGRGQMISTQMLTFLGTNVHAFSVEIPTLAAPKARIFVFTVVDPGQELVVAVAEVKVTDYYDNFLNLSVSKSSYEPGEQVSLVMATTPGSTVFLRGVDQSVFLLKEDKDITPKVIEQEFVGQVSGHRLYSGSDTFKIFEQSELIIFINSKFKLSNAGIKFKKIRVGGESIIRNPNYSHRGASGTRRGSRRRVTAAEVKVRKNFAETWIWREIQAGDKFETKIQETMPDTITSWVLSGYSLNPETGIGVLQKPLTLITFRLFFLTLNKPYSVVAGEIFGLEILIHNYLDQRVPAVITLKNSDAAFHFYQTPGNDSYTVDLQVGSSEVKSTTIVIKPTKFGVMKLEVKVTCPLAGDAVSEFLIVKPPGQKQERNQAVLLDLRNENMVLETLRAKFPPKRVEGADKVKISVISDLLGSTVSNLDKLLKIPHGCGEQNMVTFVPDIVVLEYLKVIGKLTEKIKLKAINFLEIGYQRQLTYRHSDGSFSAFGSSDPFGSTWLTAFVVKSFVAAQSHITVDGAIIKKSLEFLVGRQRADGRFLEQGRLLDKGLAGGASDVISLSAYVLLAIMQVNNPSEVKAHHLNSTIDFGRVINMGLDFITRNPPVTLGVYPLTLVTYTLHVANHKLAANYQEALENLSRKVGTLTYWEPPTGGSQGSNITQPSWESSTKPLAVEMTAYNLLTYVKIGSHEKALSSAKWLISQRNAQGGFISTQDTVVGLTALGQFALAMQSNKTELRIKAGQESFEVNSENAMVLQEIVLPRGMENVTLEASGSGTALAQLSWSYYLEDKLASAVFNLWVKVNETVIKGNLNLNVCVAYESDDGKKQESNMAVMEVHLPSGYAFDKEEVTGVRGLVLKRMDLDEGATRLNIYFDSFDSRKRCVEIPTTRVFKIANPVAAYISVYDYYDTTRHARVFYSPPGIAANEII